MKEWNTPFQKVCAVLVGACVASGFGALWMVLKEEGKKRER